MRKGITLIELLAVAVVLGVLAILGIPTYRATIERQRCREAYDLLLAIYTGERLYFSRNATYLAPVTDWRLLNLDNPNSPVVQMNFTVTSSDLATSFTASAIYTPPDPDETWLTVNQDRAFTSPSGQCDT